MTFTDTHCHLADPKLADTLPAVLAEAQAVGVARFIVPATSHKDWQEVAQLERPSENIQTMLHEAWPAPKTFLLPASKKVLPSLRGKGRSKLAVRVPAHAGARRLCQVLETPLVSTSCNRAGKRACKTEREVRRQFGRKVWVVGGLIGKQKTPSQIIDGETGARLR